MSSFGGVEEHDKGWNDILLDLKKIAKGEIVVDIGVLGEQAPEDHGGPTNVQIATWHEFGTKYIPERSFLRSTKAKKRTAYEGMLAKGAKAIYERKETPLKILDRVGLKAANDVKATIRKGIPPPLADATIARKGSSKQLIDTGQLINSITWVVRKASEGK